MKNLILKWVHNHGFCGFWCHQHKLMEGRMFREFWAFKVGLGAIVTLKKEL